MTSAVSRTADERVPSIRPAVMGDLAAIERLLTASSLPIEGVRESLSSFVVAEAGGDLLGVAGLEVCCEHALLRSVAVSAAWRSRGLGRALVSRIIADAEARGIRALYLLTTTADRYFPHFGFEPITRDEVPADVQTSGEFQGICPTSATVMRRPTRPHEPLPG